MTVADPGGAQPPLFLDQTEVPRAEKSFFETAPPSPRPLSQGLVEREPTEFNRIVSKRHPCGFTLVRNH